MAAALLLMLVSGMFISAWVSLMSTRATQVSYQELAVQRRISVENSRLLSWQCAHDKAFLPGVSVSPNLSGVFAGNFGGVNTHDGWAALNIYTSTRTPGAMTSVFPFNYTGLRPASTYLATEQLRRPPALGDVDDYNAFLFLKSSSPALAGDVFVTYRKPPVAGTELDICANTAAHNAFWTVEGRTVIHSPESLFARTTPSPLQVPFRTRSLYIQSHDTYNSRALLGTDMAGNKMLPSNLPAVPSSTGPVSAAGAANQKFEGYLNVVRNNANPDNSLWHIMEREQIAGRSNFVTIDVFARSATTGGPYWMEEQSDPTYKPPGWPSGYPPKLRVLVITLNHNSLPHMRIHGVVDQIIFKGQTTPESFANAGLMTPVIFVLQPMNDDGPAVRDIRFERENNRRMILGAQHWNAAPLDISWTQNPLSGTQFNWRCMLINEYQTVMVNMPSNVTQSVRWLGGVMTNWTFKRRAAGGVNAGRLIFATDASLATGTPAAPTLASLLPRDAWLESYFFPVPPPP